MSVGEFGVSLLLGILSVLLPLALFVGLVAALVCVARWWLDRKR